MGKDVPGMENEAVRNEVLKFMPRAFVDLYEMLVVAALGPGLGVRLSTGRDVAREPVVGLRLEKRLTPADVGLWKCEGYDCGLWNLARYSFCSNCDCPRAVGAETKLVEDVEVKEGGVVPVGQAKRARLDTGDGMDGQVTRGPAKGSAHGKREGARRKDVVGEERAIALRARLDRALVRVTREIAKTVAVSARPSRGSDGMASTTMDALKEAALDVLSEVDQWRKCSRTGGGVYGTGKECGRLLEVHWLYCPYCGASSISVD